LGVLTRHLRAAGLHPRSLLKLSPDSAVLRAAVSAGASALDADASCRVSGDVIVKVYYSKPTQAVGALRWLHSPEVKAQWSDAGDVVQVLGELDTPKGYCVVCNLCLGHLGVLLLAWERRCNVCGLCWSDCTRLGSHMETFTLATSR
jgi:hypothetical protein